MYYNTTCPLNLKASKVVVYVHQVAVQTAQFVLVLFRPALEYCITVFSASFLIVMHYAAARRGSTSVACVQLSLHVEQSSAADSAILCEQGI